MRSRSPPWGQPHHHARSLAFLAACNEFDGGGGEVPGRGWSMVWPQRWQGPPICGDRCDCGQRQRLCVHAVHTYAVCIATTCVNMKCLWRTTSSWHQRKAFPPPQSCLQRFLAAFAAPFQLGSSCPFFSLALSFIHATAKRHKFRVCPSKHLCWLECSWACPAGSQQLLIV